MTTVVDSIQQMIAWQAAHQQFFAYSELDGRLDPLQSGHTDCSGLTRFLYLHFAGIDIGTWTGDECTHGELVTTSKAEARGGTGMLPGDLVFYRWGMDSPATFDHVNMYVGGDRVQNHGGPGRGPVVQSLMSNVDSAATVMVRRYITKPATPETPEDDMPYTLDEIGQAAAKAVWGKKHISGTVEHDMETWTVLAAKNSLKAAITAALPSGGDLTADQVTAAVDKGLDDFFGKAIAK